MRVGLRRRHGLSAAARHDQQLAHSARRAHHHQQAAVGIGLFVSTLARSADQATSLIPLFLIPQLLFGAALVPFAHMQTPIKALADLMASRWGFAGAGHIIDMNARLTGVPTQQRGGYGLSFFSPAPQVSVMILTGITAAVLLITAWLLASRARRASG